MKTKNAIQILKRRAEKKPSLKKAYEEEKLNFQIACLIRETREAAGLTQSQLASLIGTKQSVISRVENARTMPSLAFLKRLATVLDASLQVQFKF